MEGVRVVPQESCKHRIFRYFSDEDQKEQIKEDVDFKNLLDVSWNFEKSTFSVELPERTWVFCAKGNAQCCDWVRCFSSHKKTSLQKGILGLLDKPEEEPPEPPARRSDRTRSLSGLGDLIKNKLRKLF